MKIAEAVFEILYLLFAVGMGIWLLSRSHPAVKLTGLIALILGAGDAFHLVPRIFDTLGPVADRTVSLGLGKFVTSVTMTLFYLLLEEYRQMRMGISHSQEGRRMSNVMLALCMVRIVLCFLPMNEWTSANPPLLWGIIRNIPFVSVGTLTVLNWLQSARIDRVYRFLPLAVTLSFLFYLPVVLLAGTYKMVGMLMLPKTVMYVWILIMFGRASRETA